jgi:hypothetical protein
VTASTPTAAPVDRPMFPSFPVSRPEECDDRISADLMADVAAVLERHGYPPVADLRDQAALGLHLYRFLYQGR